MGWFWERSSEASGTSSDAYSQLDPALRKFLDNESSSRARDTRVLADVQAKASEPVSSDGAPATYRMQIGLHVPGLDQEHQDSDPQKRPAIPPESLFQDGRYAHLWREYRPQEQIEASMRSDQDKLADVVNAYNNRRAAIGRAAVENCVVEQMAQRACFENGGWKKKMAMCRDENRSFYRCYTMQARFLKALGYLSSQNVTSEELERIEMHADKLYHEMLEREQKMDEAKKAGAPAPVFEPLLQNETTTKTLGESSAWARARKMAQAEGIPTNLAAYDLERQQEIKERIKGLNEQEKELELQLIAAESRAHLEYAVQLRDRMEEERLHRAERRERGKESLADAIKRWWGWEQ